jgi:hypothetical protein
MRAVSRKDFLSHGGVGLIGAMLLGAAGCNRSDGKVVRFFTGIRETAALESRAGGSVATGLGGSEKGGKDNGAGIDQIFIRRMHPARMLYLLLYTRR